jgi:hypothetical protein
MSSPRYGLDTGFFFALMRGDDRPWSVWTSITDGAASGVVSTLSVYELQRAPRALGRGRERILSPHLLAVVKNVSPRLTTPVPAPSEML